MTNQSSGGALPAGAKWKLIVGIALGIIAVAVAGGLVVCGYFYNGLTVVKPPETYGTYTFLDAKSAADKLRLLEKSHKTNGMGFVRLNEQEINSILHWMFFDRKPKPISSFSDPPQALRDWSAIVPPNSTDEPSTCKLLDARMRFEMEDNSVVWNCWATKSWHGHVRTIQWERKVRVARTKDGWGFALEEMRVGSRLIPEKYWTMTERFLGDADTQLSQVYKWFQKLPAVELKPNDSTQLPELVLYNYAEPKVVSKTAP